MALRRGKHPRVGGLLHGSCMAGTLARGQSKCQCSLIMQTPQDATLVRIYIGESDRWEHRPLYEAIVLKAREMGMAGATVLRGPMGFGKSSILHTAKILRLSMDLPVVIEVVDTEEKTRDFLAALGPMVGGGLVTTEQLKVIHYEAGPPAATGP